GAWPGDGQWDRGGDLSSLASRIAPHLGDTASGGYCVSEPTEAIDVHVDRVIVSLRDVHRDYPLGAERVHALQGVSLDVERGDYVAIVGPSGSGKSTLLNLVGVIDQPTSGTVEIGGKRVDHMSDWEATSFRLHNIGFVFQRFYLMPILSALENVALPMAEANVDKHDRRERAVELLSYVGLGNRKRHRPSQLSGGGQQRGAIARALAN